MYALLNGFGEILLSDTMKLKTKEEVRTAVRRYLKSKKLRFSTSMKAEYRWDSAGTDTIIRVILPKLNYDQVLNVWGDVCNEIYPKMGKRVERRLFIIMDNEKRH